MTTRSELVALLRDAETVLWDAISQQVNGAESIHQRVARALAAEAAAAADGTCLSCGNALTQPAVGRPRLYCREACKKRAHRSRRAS